MRVGLAEECGGGLAAGLGWGVLACGGAAEGVGGVGAGLGGEEAVAGGGDALGCCDELLGVVGLEEVGELEGIEAQVVAELGRGEAGVAEQIEEVGVEGG